MCVLSIKVPIRKKSGNLFNDPRIYIYIYIYSYIYILWHAQNLRIALSNAYIVDPFSRSRLVRETLRLLSNNVKYIKVVNDKGKKKNKEKT